MSQMPDRIQEHITQYLGNSVFLNAVDDLEPAKVRSVLIEYRDALAVGPLTGPREQFHDSEIEETLTTLEGTDRVLCDLLGRAIALIHFRVHHASSWSPAAGEKEQQSSKRSDLTDKLREHITQYLATSGLFPENGQHCNVRDSLIKCRDTLAAPLTEEQAKLNWFDEEIEHCLTTLQGTDRLVCHLVTEIKSLFSARVRLQRKE
jgi:hypothetical protein